MTTVLRKSTFTRTPTSLNFGSSVYVAIVRDATNLTHEVKITLGSRSAVAASAATTSASYTIPTSWGDQVASGATSGTATITVTTKNGSAVVGSDTTTITLNLIPNTLSINNTSRTIGEVLGITIGQQSTNLTTTIQYIGYTTAPVLYPTDIATKTASTSLNWTLPNAIASASYFPSNVASSASMKIRATTYNGSTQIGSYTEKVLTVYLKASSASISPTSLNFGSNITTTINRIDSRLTHDVKYTVGTSTKTITGVTTSNTSTIDAAWIGNNQNLKTATGSVQTTTKNGSAVVGSVSSSFTATVPVSSFSLSGHSPVVLGKDLATTGTINYTISRAHTTLTHTITYVFGNQSGTIATKTTATTGSWQPPLTLANAIPNGVSGGGTITVETFNGTVSVGQTSIGFTVNLHANIIPTLSATALVINPYPSTTNYVQGKSKSRVTITAANGGAGTTGITSYSYTLDNKSYTLGGINTPVDSDTLINAGAKNIVVTVKDSRNRTASLTIPITVYAYTTPTLTKVDVYRSNALGVKNDSGNNLAFKISGNIAAVNNSNTRHLLVQYKESAASTYTTVPIATDPGAYVFTDFSDYSTTISGEKSYDVKVTLTDGYSASDIEYAIVPSTFAFLEFQGGANGTGVAVGKTAELANTLDVGLLGKFREDVTFDKAIDVTAASRFRSNITLDGTITANFNPTIIPASSNLNNYETPGMFYCPANATVATLVNSPTTNAFAMLVERHAGVKQTVTVYSTTDVSTWVRNKYSTAWGTWRQLWGADGTPSGLTTAYNHSQATHAPTNAQANQTLTSGNGMAAWTATSGNLTISLGTPGSLSGSTTNATTATSHTHAVSLTAANVGALPVGGTAADSSKLGGIAASGYLLASSDTASGNHEFYGTDTTNSYSNAPIEIREVNLVAAAQSSESYAPSISYHWGGRVAKSLYMNSAGVLKWGAIGSGAEVLTITSQSLSAASGWTKFSNGYAKTWHTVSYTILSSEFLSLNTNFRTNYKSLGVFPLTFTSAPVVQITSVFPTEDLAWEGSRQAPGVSSAGGIQYYRTLAGETQVRIYVEAYGPCP